MGVGGAAPAACRNRPKLTAGSPESFESVRKRDEPTQALESWTTRATSGLNNAGQEGPHLVRLRKADLKQRINGQLTLRYEAGGLTSFAGLELIGRLFRSLKLKGALRGVQGALPRSDFGSVPMVLLVLTMLITGARRVASRGASAG